MQQGSKRIEHDCELSRSKRPCWERRYDDLYGKPVEDGTEMMLAMQQHFRYCQIYLHGHVARETKLSSNAHIIVKTA